MARVKTKGLEKHHAIRLTESRPDGDSTEAVLVRGGRRAYLGIRITAGVYVRRGFLCGPEALRALARAILREVPRKRGQR